MGTNTFNLLIAEVDSENNYHRLYSSKVPVKLGDGITGGKITDAAIQRALVALEAQIAAIRNHYCERILAFATSAVRSASNSEEFVQEIKDRFRLSVRVIDGSEEATHIYHGVQLAKAIHDGETALIMDIGGGSTEFIIADEEEILWKGSFEIGVSRVLEKFKPSDPIQPKEIKELEAFFHKSLDGLFEAVKENNVDLLVGSSGSFETLAEMIAHRFYDPSVTENIEQYDFKMEDYEKIHEMLIRSTKGERLQMPGLIRMRVDMIVLATIFIKQVLRETDIEKMRLSSYALREGVLFDILKGNL